MNFLIIFVCIVIIILLSGFIHYKYWRARLVRRLDQGSSILNTSMGPVEYASIGPEDGPVLLLSHGGGAGYDGVYLYDFLTKEGFRVICPSKPGYLRTPMEVGRTFEEHADMLAAVLDALGIQKKVAILGVSLGGPAAIQFAIRHADRTACLIMQDAVSQEYHPSKEAEESIIGRLFLSPPARKFLSWMMWILSYLWPRFTFKTYLQIESLYDKKRVAEIAEKVMSDPVEIRKFKVFADRISPLPLRAPGMDNEMMLTKKLPRYPLEGIKVPTLVTQSTMDRDVPRSHGDFVAKTVPNAESYYFSGCGHMFWFGEEWPRIRSKLVDFLKRNLAPPNLAEDFGLG